MPYKQEFVEPEIFLEHKGLTVWRTYRDEEYDKQRIYWFNLNPGECTDVECQCGEEVPCHNIFDARGLPGWEEPPKGDAYDGIRIREERLKTILIAAIDEGILKPEGVDLARLSPIAV